jgi:hypothetical protein
VFRLPAARCFGEESKGQCVASGPCSLLLLKHRNTETLKIRAARRLFRFCEGFCKDMGGVVEDEWVGVAVFRLPAARCFGGRDQAAALERLESHWKCGS